MRMPQLLKPSSPRVCALQQTAAPAHTQQRRPSAIKTVNK